MTVQKTPTLSRRVLLSGLATGLAAGGLGGCAMIGPRPAEPVARREVAWALTTQMQLLRFNAATPGKLLAQVAVKGLQPGETLLGMDFRAKNDTLYALGSSNRLYTLDTETGQATAVGQPFAVSLRGREFGFDFNPTVDRIRVASDEGQNLRLHPDTGAVVDADPALPGVQTDGTPAFADGDANARQRPRVVAAAYSYNKADPKITTNFAIDAATGTLVTQGSREGVQPMVSPNTGRLFTVGPLNAGPFDTAAFDIHVLTDLGFAALTARDARSSRWVEIDLKTGRAQLLGTIAGGQAVVAVAFESW